MHFRIGGDFDVEVVTGLVADEFHQLVGETQLAAGHAHAGRQVAAQGDDALDAGILVVGQQGAQFGLAVADAGQVRRGGYLHLAVQLQHGLQGAVAGGAAGAIGAGEEVRLVGGQVAGGGHEFFMPGFGLGGEELEAVTAFLGHGEGFLLSGKRQASSCKRDWLDLQLAA
ncbi:hypothetical protein D9M71_492400 [compost metagenome]